MLACGNGVNAPRWSANFKRQAAASGKKIMNLTTKRWLWSYFNDLSAVPHNASNNSTNENKKRMIAAVWRWLTVDNCCDIRRLAALPWLRCRHTRLSPERVHSANHCIYRRKFIHTYIYLNVAGHLPAIGRCQHVATWAAFRWLTSHEWCEGVIAKIASRQTAASTSYLHITLYTLLHTHTDWRWVYVCVS